MRSAEFLLKVFYFGNTTDHGNGDFDGTTDHGSGDFDGSSDMPLMALRKGP